MHASPTRLERCTGAARRAALLALPLLALGACATPKPAQAPVLVGKQEWAVGEGPLVSDLVALPQKTVAQVYDAGPAWQPPKGKFETDQEYARRMAAAPQAVFITLPLITTRGRNCESHYEHAAGKYTIGDCLPFPAGRVAQHIDTVGTPMTLPHPFGSRSIKRTRGEDYYLQVPVRWSQQFTLGRDAAEFLDRDLMAGIVIDKVAHGASSCERCAWRQISDTWIAGALKDGVVHEDWRHVLGAESFSRMVIFRRSDRRVLYEARYAPQAIHP